MPIPEATPEIPLTRGEKEKLLQKMYAVPLWIAIIRLFGYNVMPMEQARQEIKPIAEQYGKEPTANASEALVEIVTQKGDHFARLKSHVRRMAFQILGPEPLLSTTNPAAVPGPSSQQSQMPKKPCARSESSDDKERPVKQSRHFVLKQFQMWMNESGSAFVAIEDVQRTTPAVAPFIGSLDFIVLRGDAKLLVTVRPSLQAKHVNAIRELQKLFGPPYQPVRFWPIEGPDGWHWKEYPVDGADAARQSGEVAKPSLDPLAALPAAVKPNSSSTPPTAVPSTAEPPMPSRPRRRRKENAQPTPTATNRLPAVGHSSIMQQYRAAKEKHPDMLLLFRMGDFYELFGDDAETAHKLLGLTLTTRDQTLAMAGFPHHQLETYLHKLLKEGQRVALCEPAEETLARGPIRREITRVVTDGSMIEGDASEPA